MWGFWGLGFGPGRRVWGVGFGVGSVNCGCQEFPR